MHTFKINVLIRLLVSTTCFELLTFIIRQTTFNTQFNGVFVYLCKQSSRWKKVLDTTAVHKKTKNACTNGVPDVEHVLFETSRTNQALN
jgi:hypothetical protein